MEKQFDKAYIDGELQRIGARVKKPLSAYLIGGCAMSFRGLKESTKDIDMVFKNRLDCQAFCEAVSWAGYIEPVVIKSEHERLEAMRMLENKDGLHLDLFAGRVLRKLALSNQMIERAEHYRTCGGLSVYLLSKEDVFLFKGLASESRKRDLPDMRVLYPGLDWGVVKKELFSQHLSRELVEWFARRLEEFRKEYGLDVPILAELKRMTRKNLKKDGEHG